MTKAQETVEILTASKCEREAAVAEVAPPVPLVRLILVEPGKARPPDDPADVLPALGGSILWLGG